MGTEVLCLSPSGGSERLAVGVLFDDAAADCMVVVGVLFDDAAAGLAVAGAFFR